MAVLDEYSGALQSLGSDLFSFLQNLGSVYQEMKSISGSNGDEEQNSVKENPHDISFSCVPEQGRLTLHFRTADPACGYLWAGVLKVRQFNSLSFSMVTLHLAKRSCDETVESKN